MPKKSFIPSFGLFTLLGLCTASAAQALDITTCGTDLTVAGATYVLQNDLDCAGTALWIRNDNITLDLNGHTVMYGSANEDNRYGIALPAHWGMTEFEDKKGPHNYAVIKNGTLTQNGTGENGHGIRIYSNDHHTIDNVKIIVKSHNADGIHTDYVDGNMTISNCYIDDKTQTILSRHAISAAINLMTLGSGTTEIYNNTIVDSPQQGIRVASQSVDNYPVAIIHDNDISIDAQYANSYGIGVDARMQFADIYNNYIHSPNGRGITVQCSNSKIHHNTIDVQEGAHPPEYPDYLWTHGIKIEGLVNIYPQNNDIYENDITVRTREDGHAIGLSVSLQDGMANNRFHHNTITALQPFTNRYATCVELIMTGSSGTLIHDNTFKTENRHVTIPWLGGYDVTFRRNYWVKMPSTSTYYMLYYDNGNANNATDIRFFDPILIDTGQSQFIWNPFSSVRWSIQTDVLSEYIVGWSIQLKSTNTTVPGLAKVEIVTTDDTGNEVLQLIYDGPITAAIPELTDIPVYKNSNLNGLEQYANLYRVTATFNEQPLAPVDFYLTAPVEIEINPDTLSTKVFYISPFPAPAWK